MSTPLNIVKDPVDELLKADAVCFRDGYIDDAGFTLRVMDALPARRKVSAATRVLVPIAFSLVAAIIAVLFIGGGNFYVDAVMDIATDTFNKSTIALGAMIAVMIVMAISAASDR